MTTATDTFEAILTVGQATQYTVAYAPADADDDEPYGVFDADMEPIDGERYETAEEATERATEMAEESDEEARQERLEGWRDQITDLLGDCEDEGLLRGILARLKGAQGK